MAAAAWLDLPFPEAGVIEQDSLADQTRELAGSLPQRPLVLGGCCCAHVGAVQGLARRGSRLAVVWLDAHGDLNTPATSPSGNPWGMPLRMLLDDEVVGPENVALVGARSLDPPEVEYLRATGIDDDVARALDGVDAVYVALDVDVLDPEALDSFVPEPRGPGVDELAATLRIIPERATLVGAGVTGLVPTSDRAIVVRLLAELGL
jgi:arginase